VTAAGLPTIHKRSKTRINDLYTAAIGSRTLAAVKRTLPQHPRWMASPASRSVQADRRT
jgi:hypothetical protein